MSPLILSLLPIFGPYAALGMVSSLICLVLLLSSSKRWSPRSPS